MQIKYNGAVRGEKPSLDYAWVVVRPAGEPANATKQGVAAHLEMLHGERRDHNSFAVVHGAGLEEQHLPLLVDQQLHLAGMAECLQNGVTQQYAVLREAEGEGERSARCIGCVIAHSLITSPVFWSMTSISICSCPSG